MSTWGGNPSFGGFKLPDEHEELRAVLRDLCKTQIQIQRVVMARALLK